jgi:DNA-binding NarL/FixJ family response regulator
MAMALPVHNGSQQTICVLIVTDESLFGVMLEELLAGEHWLQVRRIAPHEPESLLHEIYQHRPLVVVVVQEALGYQLHLIANQVKDYGRLRFVLLSSENNEIHVCQSDRLLIAGVTDLVTLINTLATQ